MDVVAWLNEISQDLWQVGEWYTISHWGRVTHICVDKLTIIGSDNGLLPGRRQAIIWTNAGILLIEPLRTNFSEILIGIQIFSFKKMRLKMSSAKWRPFCLGLNVILYQSPVCDFPCAAMNSSTPTQHFITIQDGTSPPTPINHRPSRGPNWATGDQH